jgi:hypothetical protein
MKRRWITLEVVAWSLFFIPVILPVALVLTLRRKLGHGTTTADARIEALLGWYPEAWRARHGEGLREVVQDTIEDGRDGLRVSLDVARTGVAERVRALDPHRMLAAAMLAVGWLAFFSQGFVAALLAQIDGLPPTWFLALHLEGTARWLIIAAMIAGGLVLVDRSLWVVRPQRSVTA